MEKELSPLAQRIYSAIANSSTGHLAVWTIADMLDIPMPNNFCGSGEWTETDTAMKELVNGGFIEELPDLHCRYRVKVAPPQANPELVEGPTEARALVERATAPDSTEEDRERFYEASERAGSIRSQGPVANDAAPRMLAALQRVVGWADRYELECPFCEMWGKFDAYGEIGNRHDSDCPWPAIRQAVAEATGEGAA